MADFHAVSNYVIVYSRDVNINAKNGAEFCLTVEESVGNFVTQFKILILQTHAKTKFANATCRLVSKTQHKIVSRIFVV